MTSILPSPMRRLAVAAVAMATVMGFATVSQALSSQRAELEEQRTELEEQQEQNTAEREQLESELEGTDTDLAAAYLALQDANARLPEAEADLAQAEADLAAAERTQESLAGRLEVAESQLADVSEEIAGGVEQIEAARSSIGELARTTYRGGSSLSGLQVVFNATSSEEFVSQYSRVDSAVRSQTQVIADLENLTAVNRNRLARQDAVAERVNELKEAADVAFEAADAARAAAATYAQEIRDIRDTQEALAEQLEEARENLAADLEAKEAEYEEMASTIADIMAQDRDLERQQEEASREAVEQASREQASRDAASRDAAEQASRNSTTSPGNSSGGSGGGSSGGSGGGSSGGSGSGSGGGSGTSGALAPPVPAPVYVTSPYGYRIHPIAGYRWMHDGVDLRSTCGEAQTASAAGTVAQVRGAAGNASHGNQVFIDHGTINGSRYITVYNHLSSFAVSAGQQVSQGQTIGYTGATGNVTGCHVHFEVWKDGYTIDPMNLAGFTRRYS